MSTFALIVKDIETLTEIGNKIYRRKALSESEKTLLIQFLQNLPPSYKFLRERISLNEPIQYEIFDFKQLQPHLTKWVALFDSLPKNNTSFPKVNMCDPDEYDDFWKQNIIIEVDFIPSLVFSKRNADFEKTISLKLKTNGSALFEFINVKDAELYHELYSFNGTWKEAYLLTVKTLKEGWPQTKFPEEFEQILK